MRGAANRRDQGIFTKELEDALLDGRADLAVHSMKDVPTEFPPACRIADGFQARRSAGRAGFRTRRNARAIAARRAHRHQQPAARVAIAAFRPDFQIAELRGNVDTRLRKVAAGEYDAIVLAKAGIDRLGLSARITEVLPPEIMLPAVGQGALGVEFSSRAARSSRFCDLLMDQDTMRAVKAERALLARSSGRLPVAAGRLGARGEMAGWCWMPACFPPTARKRFADAPKKSAIRGRCRESRARRGGGTASGGRRPGFCDWREGPLDKPDKI